MGITSIFWIRALKLTKSATDIYNIIYFLPLGSLIFIAYLLNKKMLFPTVIGLILIILGINIQKNN